MADSGAIRAGRAFVELFADRGLLTRGLTLASNQLKAWGNSVTAIGKSFAILGAGITAPILAAAYTFVETASSLNKMSQRTGIAIEDLSALGYAAKRSGLDTEQFELGIKKLQKELYTAGEGSEQARKAFQQLGLSAEQLRTQTPDQALETLADRFASIKDPTLKAGLAMQIFGRSGTDMIPFLNRGRAGIDALKKEAAELGVVLNGDDVKAAKEFKGVMAQLQASATGVALAIGRAVIPGMARLRDLILPAVKNITTLARENAALFDRLFDIATGITIAGVALIGFGKFLVVAAAGVALFKSAMVLLLSPIGLVGISLASLAVIWTKTTDAGKAAQVEWARIWKELQTTAMVAWGGIKDALASGDLGLAASIGLKGLQIAWINIIAELKLMWADLVKYIAGSIIAIGAVMGAIGLITKNNALALKGAAIAFGGGLIAGTAAKPEKITEERDIKLADANAELSLLNEKARLQKNALPKKAAEAAENPPLVQAIPGGVGDQGTTSSFAALRLSGGSNTIPQQQLSELKGANQKLDELIRATLAGTAFN